ncbi:MAG: hypothetical protein ACRC4Z_00045 [Fusobacteriaceae bacterium]
MGPSRKEKLIQYFGTIEKIFGAELEELKKILPERVAERIKEHKKL